MFQCVIAAGGRSSSFVIFNYADGLSKLTDVPVQAGVNAAFRPTANFLSIADTSDISNTSNVDVPGVWMFRINGRPFARPCNLDKYIYVHYFMHKMYACIMKYDIYMVGTYNSRDYTKAKSGIHNLHGEALLNNINFVK